MKSTVVKLWAVFLGIVLLAPRAYASVGLMAAEFSTRISQSSDDAEEAADGEVILDSSDLEMIEDYYQGSQVVGLRFQGVTVPKGATISSAYIEFTVDETSSTSTSLTFHGEADNDASTFKNVNNDISDRPTTSASVSWNSIPAWNSVGATKQSPDLSSLVQEIVNQSGWPSGNALAFIVSGSGKRVAESYDGGSPSTRPLLKIVYDQPSTPSAFEAQITQSSDDAEEATSDGSVSLGSSDLELIDETYRGEQVVGLRFQGVSVPQGATITNAYIEFTVDETTSTTTSLTFYGQASDDANTFTSTSNDISSRPTTSTSVSWDNVPAWNLVDDKHQSPNLSSVVQDIINRSGWSPGNDIAFIIVGTGQRIAYSYDKGVSSASPLLRIEYATGQQTPSPTLGPTPNPTTLAPTPKPTPLPTPVPVTIAPTPRPTPLPLTPSPTPAPNPSPSNAVEVRIAQSSDDAEEATNDGGVYIDSSDLELIEDDYEGTQIVGLRFQGIAVPQGATITSAYIEFTVDETGSTSTSLTFHGQVSDNASTFTTATNDVSDRPQTSASVDWNNVPAWNTADTKQQSPDLKSLVQEIVDRSGWSLGNAMAFVISGSGQRIAYSYDGGNSNTHPLLKIEYTTAEQTPAPTPKASPSPTTNPTSVPTPSPLPASHPPTETLVRVVQSSDDAEEAISNGAVSLDSSDLELIDETYRGEQVVGLRFQGVSIPQSATVTSAYIEFTVDETTSSSTTLTIHGEISDDVSTFTPTTNDISSRPTTASSVAWNNIAPWTTVGDTKKSPDVSSIVQEIVNRSGWSAGNAMAFVLSGSGQRVAVSYDGDSNDSPLLRIEYVPSCSDGLLNGDETGVDCGGSCWACSGGGDPVPLGQSGTWNLVFSDEFDGTDVDQTKWERGWFSNTGYSYPVNSREDSCYHPSQLQVSGGNLRITAEAHLHPDCRKKDNSPASYVSGLVNSRQSFTFSYGYTEARVWLPSDAGGLQNWPAVWHTGFDHPATGEIDIMEGLSPRQPCASYHWGSDSNYNSVTECANMADPGGWHVFAAKWEPGKITFYCDGAEFFVHTEGVVGSPHYLILNQGLYSNYGIDVPATMLVDYIRVWSLP